MIILCYGCVWPLLPMDVIICQSTLVYYKVVVVFTIATRYTASVNYTTVANYSNRAHWNVIMLVVSITVWMVCTLE